MHWSPEIIQPERIFLPLTVSGKNDTKYASFLIIISSTTLGHLLASKWERPQIQRRTKIEKANWIKMYKQP